MIRDKIVLIDDEDAHIFEKYSWHLNNKRNKFYVCRDSKLGGRKMFYLHRTIMSCPTGYEVDHINGNPLDNRRSNLRICTPSQNRMNIGKKRNNTSGVKGAYFRKENTKRPWRAMIRHGGKMLYLGTFSTPEEAHEAYKLAAVKYFGEFANFG